MKSSTDIITVEGVRAERMPEPEDLTAPAVGRWYWYADSDKDVEEDEDVPTPAKTRLLICVVSLGSNYAEVEQVKKYGGSFRVKFDEWDRHCEFIANPEEVIHREVTKTQREVHELMAGIKTLTARLAIQSGPELTAKPEVETLAVRQDQPVDEYKTALIKAKDETLPAMFEEIRKKQEHLTLWMSANLIPLVAQAKALEPLMAAIKGRIFNVELYAGLSEQIVQVREGAAAPLTTPIHLMQRRAYMDEECLAEYRTGGMEFNNIGEFDAWLAEDANMLRLLPHPRCILAFQVRRNVKDREIRSLAGGYIHFGDMMRAKRGAREDMYTFLYLRNGDQLFRLATQIEFESKLFPDMSVDLLGKKLWALMSGSHVVQLATDDAYQQMVLDRKEEQRKYDAASEDEKWRFHRYDLRDWHPFEPTDVYYDDISAYVKAEMEKHNRLVLVLQGILDRSPVFHPHPPWSLWHHESFNQALSLVYDLDRVLVAGEKPDFEAYRASLNASIKEGSITVGQEAFWHRLDKRDKDSYVRYLDKGPGYIARVASMEGKGKKKCNYAWTRERATNSDKGSIHCSVTVPVSELFHVDAYKPGDFKKFFADPRTRAEYLKWAPFLLEAEEYHAGNRQVAPIPKKPHRPPPDRYKQMAYRQRKEAKAFEGKAVRLTRDVETTSGKEYEPGTLWAVYRVRGSKLYIRTLDADGYYADPANFITGVSTSYVELAPEIEVKGHHPKEIDDE